MTPTTLLLCWLAVPQAGERIGIPNTPLEVEVVAVPPGGGLPETWMARTEVTVEQFLEYYERRERTKVDGLTRPSAPYEPPHGEMGAGRHPACGMRWHAAAGFCLWLSKVTGHKFRLPTEKEWEHAARAGTGGELLEAPEGKAWSAGNAGKKTHPVGTKEANAFGLHDLMGNVWEYALEPMTPGQYAPVLRGGAWNTPEAELKFGTRQPILPLWYDRDPNRPRSLWWLTDARFVGFRVLRVGPAKDQEAQRAYAAKVEVRNLSMGTASDGFVPVAGEVFNGGDRPLSELELTVHAVTPAGKPIFEDEKGRATFTLAYPVLTSSVHPGAHALPLKPGESRAFGVRMPEAYEIDEQPEKAGAVVSGLRFGE
jgi:hypothetical protein